MSITPHTYYVVRTGPDRFDLRQTRYVSLRQQGKEHPHDLMATCFTAVGMREIIGKWFADTDTSELDRENESAP